MGKDRDWGPSVNRLDVGILCCLNANWLTPDFVSSFKFFLEVILENKSDEDLYEVAVFNSNKHNDTTLTLLMKNYDVFRDTIGKVGNGFYRNLGKTRTTNVVRNAGCAVKNLKIG